MEENLKLYSKKAITIATFFGGPLVAGILIRRNFLNLGEERKAINSLLIGILSTVLLIFGILMIPENIIDYIPNVLFPAIYTGIVNLIVKKNLGDSLISHAEKNGELYSGWKAAGVSILSAIIIVFIAFAFILLKEQSTKIDTEPTFSLNVIGNCMTNENDTTGIEISLIGGKKVHTVNKSSFEFILEYDNFYSAVFKKIGYQTKTIDISTQNIPINRWNKGFLTLKFDVELFPLDSIPPNGDTEIKPLIKYYPEIDDFDHNKHK